MIERFFRHNGLRPFFQKVQTYQNASESGSSHRTLKGVADFGGCRRICVDCRQKIAVGVDNASVVGAP